MRVKHSIATICYLEKENKVLFLKFDKKWGQVYAPPGGKMDEGESPFECIIREFKEETGLTIINPKLKGYSYWNYVDKEYGIIFIYKAKEYIGELKSSTEGNVMWINKNEISKLKQFDMNSKFTDLIFDESIFEGNFTLNDDDTVKEYKINKL